MGHRLTASEETQLLRDTIREAHEAAQQLLGAIREARQLAPSLVEQFEELHHRELAQLSNHMTEEGNRAAAALNESVRVARDEIVRQLTVAEFRYDAASGYVRLGFSDGKFDDHVQPPFPEYPTKETT